ncbi:MAG: hypothetical protein N3D18_12210 [Roseococcus sp.]|nr:hypothetical protein [Roseococcus sp.]
MSGSTIVLPRPPRGGAGGIGLPPGGHGPDDPVMGARLARREPGLPAAAAALARIDNSLADVREEQADQAKALARPEGRVSQPSTRRQRFLSILGVLAVAGVTRVLVG